MTAESSIRGEKKNCKEGQNGARLRDQFGYRLRAAAVCLRHQRHTEILLITGAKNESVWVVPGGGIELNETAAEAAIREVCEEAGVIGTIIRAVGTFVDELRKNKTMAFLVNVCEELSTWEDGLRIGRRRQWLPVDQAIHMLKPQQRAILRAVISR